MRQASIASHYLACRKVVPVSIAYAVRHPERVSHLILLGGYPLGWKKRARTQAEKEAGEAMLTLVRLGWGPGKPGIPADVHGPSSFQGPPKNSRLVQTSSNEFRVLQPMPARNLIANGEVDVTPLLAQVRVPDACDACPDRTRGFPLNRAGGSPQESRERASFRLKAQTMCSWKASPHLIVSLKSLRSFL
jgi:pimeloyl-ACP methyl ester carboxylesterase